MRVSHLLRDLGQVVWNVVLIVTYWTGIGHFYAFERAIRTPNLEALSERERLRLANPRAQNEATTFAAHQSLMAYFADYIVQHNRRRWAVIPFTTRHYQILTAHSRYLSMHTPVVLKIRAYLAESSHRFDVIQSSYGHACATNDATLHRLMCCTHLMQDATNRVFRYETLDMEHYGACRICQDESIWFANAGTQEEARAQQRRALDEHYQRIEFLTDPANYPSVEAMTAQIAQECGCTADEAAFLISATAEQKMQLVATFLGMVPEGGGGDPPEDDEDATDATTSAARTTTDVQGRCPFAQKTKAE